MTCVLENLWKHRRPLLAFALAFQLLENLLFTPAMGLIGRALDGRPAIDSTALVEFFVSPRGLLVLFLSATVSLTIRLVEHAGLSALALGAMEGKPFQPLATLRWLLPELPQLLRIGGRIVLWGLTLMVPVAVLAGSLVPPLLRKHDINYYLSAHPPEFILVAGILGTAALAALGVGACLFVRWRLVVQVCAFQQLSGVAAFRAAALLSRGRRGALAFRCVGVVAFQFLLLLLAAILQQVFLWVTLHFSGGGEISLVMALLLGVFTRTIVGALVTSVGAAADAAVFTAFYQKLRNAQSASLEFANLAGRINSRKRLPFAASALALGLFVELLVATVMSVGFAVDGLHHDRPITVTAHRGDHHRAPENTLAAIRDAIAAGADYAEIDVQLSKDGVLVVTHDSDFSRLGGIAKKVWDLNYAEIAKIPLGTRSAPEFRNESAPTLDEVLAVARDRIRLNIELKYYGDHQPHLAARVIAALRKQNFINQAIIQCLQYEPLMEVRQLAPELPIGYLFSVNATRPNRLEVDFLGAEISRVTGAFVHSAHRHGHAVHVWTVDSRADMDRLIALGVDDLITNQPVEARRRVQEFQQLNSTERTMRRLRAWLTD